MADLESFSKRIREIGVTIEENATKITRETALAVDQQVVVATPVDTGRARANWQVSVNAPILNERTSFAEGESGSSASANAQLAIESGRDALTPYTGGDIYITNNLPYIQFLNQGSSAQAPANFVESAVSAGVQVVRRSRILKQGNG